MRLIYFALLTLAPAAAQTAAGDAYRTRRLEMVENQIEARGVKDPAVLEALRTVARERFVPEAFRAKAYADHPLPIGYGQTISQPYIVGFMSESLNLQKEHKVLEIGTGSGYQAAVLALLAGQVFSIEIVPELARSSAQRLRTLGYKNVTVRAGDGYAGWPEEAPFDRIILTAAPPTLPQALVDQLKPGGRLIAPVGVGDQVLVLVDKSPDGQTTTRSLLPVRFVPMTRPEK